MSDETRYTLEEAHLEFAKKLNSHVWQLLERESRTILEDEEMVHAAHASLYHWFHAGKEVHHQRGEWLLARVYTVLDIDSEALRHAARCLELTEKHADQMADFDSAYAYECLARAQALAGNHAESRAHFKLAEEAGERIASVEDRTMFLDDLTGGAWYGVR
jgi:hypothetical protein